MSNQLEQLRTHLKAMEAIRETYDKDADFTTLVNNMRDKIARLEAEADPWREAKEVLKYWSDNAKGGELWVPEVKVMAYVHHLTAEIAAKDERIAELEAALRRIATVPDCGCVPCRGQCDSAESLRVNAEEIREIARSAVESFKPVADMKPPASKPGRPHDRITMQRRIKMQRRELRRLNGMMRKYSHVIMMKDHDLEESHKKIADMVPPFEGPIVGIEPVLDPARVLATAAEAIDVAGYMLEKNTRHNVKVVMRNASMYEKPYRLKGADDGN